MNWNGNWFWSFDGLQNFYVGLTRCECEHLLVSFKVAQNQAFFACSFGVFGRDTPAPPIELKPPFEVRKWTNISKTESYEDECVFLSRHNAAAEITSNFDDQKRPTLRVSFFSLAMEIYLSCNWFRWTAFDFYEICYRKQAHRAFPWYRSTRKMEAVCGWKRPAHAHGTQIRKRAPAKSYTNDDLQTSVQHVQWLRLQNTHNK